MRIRKYPHKNYDVARADTEADEELKQRRAREFNNTETAIQDRIRQYYTYGNGRFDQVLLVGLENQLRSIKIPYEIDWERPDPRMLLALADWLEESDLAAGWTGWSLVNGGDRAFISHLRNYANKTWEKIKVEQNRVGFEPPKITNKIDYDDLDYLLDNPIHDDPYE